MSVGQIQSLGWSLGLSGVILLFGSIFNAGASFGAALLYVGATMMLVRDNPQR